MFARHSFRPGIGKLQVCKGSFNRMIIVKSAEGLMEHFLSEQKEKGLKFALNVDVGIQSYFFIKTLQGKYVCMFFVRFKCSIKRAFSDLLQNK